MTTEDWRPIPDFTGSYQILRDRRVRWVERDIGRGSLRHHIARDHEHKDDQGRTRDGAALQRQPPCQVRRPGAGQRGVRRPAEGTEEQK